MAEFVGWPKIARLSRDIVITEKIDGTNAAVLVSDSYDERLGMDGVTPMNAPLVTLPWGEYDYGAPRTRYIWAQSRTRFITPNDDNFGFAKWVVENASQLATLGEGRHFGEWWGSGIQRGYGLPKGQKRFSLFNTGLWYKEGQTLKGDEKAQPCPSCCDVVPVLYRGAFDTIEIWKVLGQLNQSGSVAAPGFMDPEGIIVYHTAGGHLYKKTFEKDETFKGDKNG